MKRLSKIWIGISLAFVVGQLIIATALKPGGVQTVSTIAIYSCLSLIATVAASRNAVQTHGASRVFWSFLALSYGLLVVVNGQWIQAVVLLHRDNPFGWVHEFVFFAELVPLMAAAVVFPHRTQSHRTLYRETLNLAVLLFFWIFLYCYFVFPYGMLDSPVYYWRYHAMYLAENLLLLVFSAVLVVRGPWPWKALYWQLFGACCLWTFSLQMENVAFESGKYQLGGVYDVPSVAACCWFVFVPLYGREAIPQLQETSSAGATERKSLSLFAMVVVVVIPLIGVWEELYQQSSTPHMHKTRIIWVLISFILIAVTLSIKEHLANRELVEDISLNLRQAEERFYKAFNSSPEGITISTQADGRYLEVNDAFLRLVEYPISELIGVSVRDLGIWVNLEDRKRLFAELARDGRVQEFQTSFRTKSGQIREVELAAESIQLQGESCLLAITRDVTQHRRLEQQLRQAQKMEAVGRLAGGVAHDFNNLLMITTANAELLEKAKHDPARVERYARQIQNATDRGAALTRQMLAFSRQQILTPTILNLNTVITELWKMLPRLLGEDIETVLALDPALGDVSADRGQLEQVIMNLAVNARDAMPQGGKLTIETANVEVDNRVAATLGTEAPSGPCVLLAVSDTGVGMTPAVQAQVFDPFFTTKELGKGTGLGLATVYGIVRQSGGSISVYSEIGKGSIFNVYFPRVQEKKEAQAVPQVEPASEVSGTILLVEDETALRQVTSEYLRAKGYKIVEARNGEAALEICRSHTGPIDLLITDIVMPGSSGPTVAKQLAEMRPGLRTIYMSGYTDRTLAPDIIGPNAAFLQKPFNLDTLAYKIQAMLNRES